MLKQTLMASTALALTVPSVSAMAQDQDDNARALDEIVVTATKREQTLQDIPVAVSVVAPETVEKAAIVDIIDLQSVVPSLRVTQLQTSSQTNFLIRGFGNGANNTGIENSVGVFIDGVYRSRSPSALLDLPILERIEVLRGPQSTLFGKNTSAGAINIITKGPEFEQGGSVELTYGNYDQVMLKGDITGPISDKVAYRLSATYNNRDGYYTNEFLNNDINDRNRYSVRGQIAINPSDNVSMRIIGEYNNIDEVCCGALQLQNGPATQFLAIPAPFGLGVAIGQDADPSLRTVNYDINPENSLTGEGISWQTDISMDWADLTSITAYRKQDDLSDSEVDFSAATIAGIYAARDFKTFTQEIRLTSNKADSDIDWVMGAFYFDEDINTGRSVLFGADTYDFLNGLTRSNPLDPSTGAFPGLETVLGFPVGSFYADGTGIIDNYTMKNKSYSLYGQFDYHLTDKLTFTGGISYIDDKKVAASDVTLTEPFNALDLPGIAYNFVYQTALATTYFTTFGVDIATDPTQIGVIEAMFPGTFAAIDAGSMAFASAYDYENAPDATIAGLMDLRALQFLNVPVNYPNANEDGILKGDKTTYTAKLAYQVSDDVNVYASYSTGWKAGAYNLSSDSTPPNAQGIGRTADPENVTVWELGIKANFNRGNIYFALFDQKIKGFQSNLFVGDGFSLANAGSQSVKGFEMDAVYLPTDNLILTLGVTHLDPVYDSFVSAPCADHDVARCGNGEEFRDLSGTRPAGLHSWSVSTSATYTHQFDNDMEGYIRWDYLYESNEVALENVPGNIASRKVNTMNMSAGLQFADGLEVNGWVRNLTNDDNLLSAFPTVIQPGSYSGYLNAPRTYGITLRKRF